MTDEKEELHANDSTDPEELPEITGSTLQKGPTDELAANDGAEDTNAGEESGSNTEE